MSGPTVSIIIPVKDEVDNIPTLVREITDVLGTDERDLEILFIDDGSTDGTLARIKEEASRLPPMRWLSFDRNYGQTAALAAGLAAARGEIIVTMDGDLQNDPQDIPALLAALEGADMVCGWRRSRRDSFIRRISSRVANRVRNWVTHEDIIDVGCSLKAMRRACAEKLVLFEGLHRFLPTLASMHGFKVVQHAVNHRPRRHGKAKYGIRNRLFKALTDLYAVRWMQRRRLTYVIRERSGP